MRTILSKIFLILAVYIMEAKAGGMGMPVFFAPIKCIIKIPSPKTECTDTVTDIRQQIVSSSYSNPDDIPSNFYQEIRDKIDGIIKNGGDDDFVNKLLEIWGFSPGLVDHESALRGIDEAINQAQSILPALKLANEYYTQEAKNESNWVIIVCSCANESYFRKFWKERGGNIDKRLYSRSLLKLAEDLANQKPDDEPKQLLLYFIGKQLSNSQEHKYSAKDFKRGDLYIHPLVVNSADIW